MCMATSLPHPNGAFQKVGECLYRYSSNGVYYARIKIEGKEIRRSLETTDRDLARRRLTALRDEQRQIDRSQGKLTLAELCDRYLATVQHQKPKTVERKTLIVRRMKQGWPSGALTQVAKIKPSQCDLWLSRYKLGPVSRNLHIRCAKAVFAMAVRDGIIASSPAENLKRSKLPNPIRLTPTYEQFKAIIADVRTQPFNADAQDSADFLEFLGLAGLGQAEASSLRRPDVDFEAGRIITFRHKTGTGFAIPLYPQVRRLLERLCEGKAHDEYIFKIKGARKALAGACNRLRYPQFTQRSLRRMFVTRALQLSVDVKTIAEWQGHKDGGKLILDTYSHVNPAHSQRMAALMTESKAENVIALQGAA
jgi:integrase